ncbi:MAG: hypothetical protein JWO56_2935 [Acidobacteria bacterium]|nr:hypothetical protein [Acidobacteriota bacterium]
MKILATCTLAFLLSTPIAVAAEKKQNISVSFDSDDARTRLAARHSAREARLAVGTREGAAVLMLLHDAVAVQLSDATIAHVKAKDDANFLEEWLVAGIQMGVRKSVEYPIANIRSAEVRDGALVLTNDEGKPVFSDIKVNGANVLHGFSAADATRFVNAFRVVKAGR